MVTKISKWSRIQDSCRITPKTESLVVYAMPDILSKFQKDPSITFWVILLTHRQTNKQTNRQTNKNWQKHNLLGGGNYVWNSQCVDWEIENVSTRQAALKSWTTSDNRCNVVSRLGQTLSNLHQKLLGLVLTLLEPSVFSATKNHKSRWKYCTCFFSDSCSLSDTGTGDGTWLQIGFPQSVDHCDRSSMAAVSNCRVACRRRGPLIYF